MPATPIRVDVLDQAPVRIRNSSSNCLAVFRPGLSKPSVNRSYTGASTSRASPKPALRVTHNRARLVAVRNSHASADCRLAISSDLNQRPSSDGIRRLRRNQNIRLDTQQFGHAEQILIVLNQCDGFIDGIESFVPRPVIE